jgi:hypothetical protein
MGEATMTMTPAQRMRVHRARRRRREVQLAIEVSETDLRDIALAGYAGAAWTDRNARAQAVAMFVSDQCFGLLDGSVTPQRLHRNKALHRNGCAVTPPNGVTH